jgi:hypothetical protein
MKHLLRTAVSMMRCGETGVMLHEIRDRLYSNEVSMVLRRDLRDDRFAPEARIPLTLRPIQPSDFPLILKERPRRLSVLLVDIPTCYVAVTDTGELAYMQWLIFDTEWEQFRPHFKGRLFAPLKPDECLFEFAYTFEKFRAKGVMGAALVMIGNQALKIRPNAHWAYNFIRQDNLPSLKGCRNAGFRPYARREERWRAGRLLQNFVSLGRGALFPFEQNQTPNQSEAPT